MRHSSYLIQEQLTGKTKIGKRLHAVVRTVELRTTALALAVFKEKEVVTR